MSIDFGALRVELELPAYGSWVAAGSDQGCADALNALDQGIAIGRGIVSRDQFVTSLLGALSYMLSLDPANAVRAPFNGWLTLLQMAEGIDTSLAAVQGILSSLQGALIQAGQGALLTDAIKGAALTRPGSRAEQLFGPGVVITGSDVGFALRGHR